MFETLSLKSRLWLLGLASTLGVAILAASAVWHAHHSRMIVLEYADHEVAMNRSAITIYAHGLQMGQALRNILLDPANAKAYENFSAANDKFRESVVNSLIFENSNENLQVAE